MNKTFMANNQTVQHNWYVVDAAGLTLGRLSTVVASLLRGKHKPLILHMLTAETMLSLLTLTKLY